MYGRDYLPQLTTGLFRASKTVHHEATSLFYGQNRFDFTGTNSENLALFLKHIGSHNAACIRDIEIDFPNFLYLDPGNVTLDESSVSILANIQSSCANLRTLKTSLDSTDDMEYRLDYLEHFKVATEALKLVNTHFRAIPSIQEIILEVYEDGPGDHVRSKMKEYGWKLSTTANIEEEDWDRGLSDVDFGRHHGSDFDDDGGGDDYDDEYDIDNDSDFWRRAAD